ncbi:hypothetical protein D3C86_1542910 [compost metagenome]
MKGSNSRDKKPPSADSTNPVRMRMTRMPSASARCAVSSQAIHNWLAKSSLTGPESSVSSRSPPSPYQPTAEPEIITHGFCSRLSSHASRVSVSVMRLLHNKALRLCVQGRSAIGAPARLTIASTGSCPRSSSRATPRTWVPHIFATFSGWRLQTVRRWPCPDQCRQS